MVSTHMEKIKNTDPNNYLFRIGLTTNINAVASDGNRRFSGVAYTGNPITNHPFWGTVVFDLGLINVPDRMAILMNHEGDEIVGYSDEHAITQDGLVLGGVLSKVTKSGQEVSALSDEGFPWQMSVRIQPDRIEELTPGATANVNGRSITGPAYIFRESKLVETSFTPTGWDSGTSATALSQILNPTSPEDSVSNDLEAKVAQLEDELSASKTTIEALKKENDELKSAIAEKDGEARMSRVMEAYKAAGKELSADQAKKFSSMPEDAVNAIVEALSLAMNAKRPVLPDGLFSHQATGSSKPTETHEQALLARCEQVANDFKSKK